MKYELKQQFHIESARFLPKLPQAHPCSRIHGHSFKIVLKLVGDLDPEIGWLYDYHRISELMEPLLAQLDQRTLNDVPGLENPTSELLAKWIFEKTLPKLPLLKTVSVMETADTECTYPANP